MSADTFGLVRCIRDIGTEAFVAERPRHHLYGIINPPIGQMMLALPQQREDCSWRAVIVNQGPRGDACLAWVHPDAVTQVLITWDDGVIDIGHTNWRRHKPPTDDIGPENTGRREHTDGLILDCRWSGHGSRGFQSRCTGWCMSVPLLLGDATIINYDLRAYFQNH